MSNYGYKKKKKSVPVIFEPPCIYIRTYIHTYIYVSKNPVLVIGQLNMKYVNTGQHVHKKNSKHENL